MKKMIMAVAIVCATAFTQAATVGWSNAGMANFKGDAYAIFVIGQNGVTDMGQITALLDAGSSYESYAFGKGVVASNGSAIVTPAASGKTLDVGTYQSFFVLFDSATPVAGEAKYVTVSGLAGQTQTVAGTTANISFATLNQQTIYNNSDNWKSFGSVPEPTSGLLLLLGMAGLALKRKVA